MHCNSRSSLNFNNIVKSQLLSFNEAGSIINEKFCLEVENNENFFIFGAPLLDVTLVVIKKKLQFHDLYTAVRSDYLTQIDFVIELVDYNLFMSSRQVEAGLVKMTLRQVDASQNLSTAPHHKTVPSDVCKSRSYSRARNRLSHKKYSCNLQLQVTLDLL